MKTDWIEGTTLIVCIAFCAIGFTRCSTTIQALNLGYEQVNDDGLAVWKKIKDEPNNNEPPITE